MSGQVGQVEGEDPRTQAQEAEAVAKVMVAPQGAAQAVKEPEAKLEFIRGR